MKTLSVLHSWCMALLFPFLLSAQNQTIELFRPNVTQRIERSISFRMPFRERAEQLKVEIVDGYAILEGDIIVETEARLNTSREDDAGISSGSARWNNATIPYEIQAGHPQAAEIQRAINNMNTLTVLRLVPRSGHVDYVRFVNGSGCSSWVGRRGGMQEITIGGCSLTSIMHEILHAAGMYHEQSRSDRDSYVRINSNNIQSGREHNFGKATGTISNCGYDFGSAMHYPATAFSNNGNPTITPIVPIPPGMVMGQRVGLSPCDIVGVNSLYGSQVFNIATQNAPAGYAIPNGLWLAGDYNGDGRMDVAHAVQGVSRVHVWFSNGNGTYNITTFNGPAAYAIPNGDWFAGDQNGDGRSDLIHAVRGSNKVHTWLSNGNGTFSVMTHTAPAGYAISNGVWMVADVNGDRKTDIIHAVNGTNRVHTWIALGNGAYDIKTFTGPAGYAIPNGLWFAGDATGDGRADILHAVNASNKVHTWRSNGDGTYTVLTGSAWAGYGIPNGVWNMGDFNGDGKMDLVHAVLNSNVVHTWFSQGNGAFNVTTNYGPVGYAIPNGQWFSGDYNGDGKADLLHLVQNSNYVHLWFSNGQGGYYVAKSTAGGGYAIPNGLWLSGNVNNDGRADIFHAVLNGGKAHIWIAR